VKRGDTIAKDTILEIGTVVLHNCSSPENAKSFMETDFLSRYNCLPGYELKQDEFNPTARAVVITQAVINHEEAIVNWVIDGACAIKYKDGNCRIFEIVDEPDWKVIIESVPSYQSSVENLTDEQLRGAIDDLRSQRVNLPTKVRKASVKREVMDKNDPLAVALSSMSADKKLELMRKMGMVD